MSDPFNNAAIHRHIITNVMYMHGMLFLIPPEVIIAVAYMQTIAPAAAKSLIEPPTTRISISTPYRILLMLIYYIVNDTLSASDVMPSVESHTNTFAV